MTLRFVLLGGLNMCSLSCGKMTVYAYAVVLRCAVPLSTPCVVCCAVLCSQHTFPPPCSLTHKHTHSQVLGELQLNKQVVQRWLSHSIRAVLSKRYPSLRIAYIDLENLGEMLPAAAGAGAAAAAAAGATRCGEDARGRGRLAFRVLYLCV